MLAILAGAFIGVGAMFFNLVLGDAILGGSVMVALVYYLIYRRPLHK